MLCVPPLELALIINERRELMWREGGRAQDQGEMEAGGEKG